MKDEGEINSALQSFRPGSKFMVVDLGGIYIENIQKHTLHTVIQSLVSIYDYTFQKLLINELLWDEKLNKSRNSNYTNKSNDHQKTLRLYIKRTIEQSKSNSRRQQM